MGCISAAKQCGLGLLCCLLAGGSAMVFHAVTNRPVFFLQYMVPFLLNQCGSLLFYLTLASAG